LCASRCSSPVDINECGTVVCTYLGFRLLDGLLYFIAGVRTFVIIYVSFGCRVRCGISVVSNSKKFRVPGNKIVRFLDFDT
jgi:hypothetical protein